MSSANRLILISLLLIFMPFMFVSILNDTNIDNSKCTFCKLVQLKLLPKLVIERSLSILVMFFTVYYELRPPHRA